MVGTSVVAEVTDRHSAYIVVLKEDLREDDAARTITALEEIKGVLSVEPFVGDASLIIAEVRARDDLLAGILSAVRK